MIRTAIVGVAGLAVGIVVGYGAFHTSRTDGAGDCNNEYPLLSDEIDCGYDDNASRIHELDSTLEQATQLYIRQGRATRVSVWTRDLKSKQWAASNENDIYSPASLLKLPLLIAYYKFSELQPSVLNASVRYEPQAGDSDSTLQFTPTTSLMAGQTYSVNELLAKMIQNSDNAASVSLFSKVDPLFYNQTLLDLGVKIPTGPDNQLDYVTVRTYASIFRSLYNASYLNRELSQKALDLMSHSSFQGIAASIPKNVVVAHKFGERTVITSDGSITKHELHDCGIVYKQPDPYSLCIMTEGKNFDDLLFVIEDLSKIVYGHL